MPAAFIKEKKVHRFTGKLDFEISDHIKYPLFSFPLTPLTYRVDFSGGGVRADGLSLFCEGERLLFQLSSTVCGSGFLDYGELTFYADLPSGASRRFSLVKSAGEEFKNPLQQTVLES